MTKTQTACQDCGIIIDIKNFKSTQQYSCPRCHSILYRPGESYDLVLTMAVTTLFFFIPTLFLPLMELKIMDLTRSVTLFEAVWFFVNDGYIAIALVAVASGIIIPLTLLALIIMMIIPIRLGYKTNRVKVYFRIYEYISNWAMAEVYLMSIFVAIIKLGGMAELKLDFGLYLFTFFLITFYITVTWFNSDDLWRKNVVEN